jgi:heme O synthase-like polyprenyltransferase
MWYDADIDAVMTRTAMRPIPRGRVSRAEALAFGLMLAAASIAVLGFAVNIAAAALLAFTIFFYVVVYTMWLKRRTPQNIVIGGAAGAFPPVIGWVAANGGIGVEPPLAMLVPNARFFVAKDSGHDIHQDQPELVTEAIRQVVAAVRNPDTWYDLTSCCAK